MCKLHYKIFSKKIGPLMFALLFPEPGHGAAQAVLPCSKTQKDLAANVEAKENRRMRALNKAVIRR